MLPAHGGHRTHGAGENQSGALYNVVSYGSLAATGELDYEQIAALAREHRPKLIVAGFSAYSRVVDWARFRAIANEVGALFLADIAHVAGLVAAGVYPNPVALADVTTTTTHKTLRGPRGGMILAPKRSALTERIDAAVFPGTQGGPLMHVIAAKAVAFQEALEPSFAAYQRQVLANARAMAVGLQQRGYSIVTGGTDNHMLLVDLRGSAIDAVRAERALHAAHIAVNRASLPGETGAEPTQGDSGLRLGTPAVTTRGLAEPAVRDLTTLWSPTSSTPAAHEILSRDRVPPRAVLRICALFSVYRR